ncbi:MAG: hypothetical protein ACNA8H_07705, partial [Anaerolineales bacterium]
FAPLPFTIPQSDQLTLIPGMIPGKIVELPQDGGYCGSGGMPAVYFGRGEAVFEFQAPEFVNNAQIEKLLLYIGTEGGWNRVPQTYLFDWSAGDWREIQSPTVGNNNIHAVEGLVNPSGMVRVRFLSENFGGGCYYVALGLEGSIEGGQP